MAVGSASNSYDILAKLAEGGMAEIFLARNATGAGVERIVVLKRILPHCANNEELVKMFIHEARLAAQLQHANIAQVYDVGKLGVSYFFTMEYVHGKTVRDLTLHARERRQRLPLPTVLTIAAGAAAGLHHAHERRGIDGRPLGIVHSDVSPSNLIISREGVVKLVDFGIARAAGSTANTDGTMRGKISYLSPEQCHSSREIDRRSDLFSLGIVVWEMLTLQGLYRRGSDYENMVAIESEPALPPSQFRKDIPQAIDDLVLRLLAKRPEDRFQTAAALLEAIEETAMQLRSALSVSALARLLQESFGDDPEPWIEQTRGGSSKLVVKAEPVPVNFGRTLDGGGAIDDKLSTLSVEVMRTPDIPGDTIPDDAPTMESLESMRDRLFRDANKRKSEYDEEDGRATIPRLPVEEVLHASRPQRPATPIPPAPPTPQPYPPARSMPGARPGPSTPPIGRATPSGSFGPAPRDLGAPPHSSGDLYQQPRRRSPLPWIVAGVSVLAIASGVVFAMMSFESSKSSATGRGSEPQHGDAGMLVTPDAPAPPTGASAATPPSAQ